MAQVQALTPKGWLPQPEPGLRPETVIERARALRPMLRAQQDEADERGWYTDEIHQAFLDAGFYRIVQPKMFGGYEFDVTTFATVVMEIARGHPSSGWCYCLGSSHSLVVASHWSEEAQRELYGKEGHLRAPHRAPPAGEFRVELTAPDGSTWAFGSEDASQKLTGSALGFCLVVTQRRHPDDTALVASGPLAEDWMEIAQAFAGPPGAGREPGQFK